MTVPEIATSLVLPVLVVTVVLTFLRLVQGPSLADRVVALDLLATVSISIIAVYAIASGQPVVLDVAVVLALISFLGTIAFAYYIGRRR